MKLFLATLVLVAGTMPAAAQWLDRPWPGIPRTADGKPNLMAPAPRGPDDKPDLSGIWNGEDPAPRPDPTDMKPGVRDLARQQQEEFFKMRPAYRCLPNGPEAEKFGGWKRVLQTPTAIAILNDDLTHRLIFMDGRELEANPAPSWMGYSVGRWDGDTLVVDSVGFNDKTWVSRRGLSHTEALRMRERYRRRDFGHLEIEVTVTDPGAYAKPWSYTVEKTLAADTEMLELVCERSSDHWSARTTETAVHVPPEVLARYAGVYSGIYQGNPRTARISLSDGRLFVTSGGGELQRLVPRSQTLFESGLGYQFIVDGNGPATHVVEIHVSGGYRYARQP
ncbi:MAG: hypothetical protein ACRD3C_05810 [Vicinamibacterales bacterium]